MAMVHRTTSEVAHIKRKFQAGFAFSQLVRANFRGTGIVTRPELYLDASFEVFLFMLAVSWLATAFFNYEIIWGNASTTSSAITTFVLGSTRHLRATSHSR